MFLGQLIAQNAVRFGARDAYVELNRRRSWQDLHSRTDALAHGLRAQGLRPGDRVAIISKDAIEVAETVIACAKAGLTRVGLNPRLAPPEIAALVDDAGVDLLFYQTDFAELVQQVFATCERSPKPLAFGAEWSDYEALIKAHLPDGSFAQTPHDRLMICYTTGSTGLPKGAIYPHEKMIESMAAIALAEGATPDDVWLHAMPASGVPIMHLLRNVFHGAPCVIVGNWDPEHALKLIERESCTICVLVPTMLNSLLESGLIGTYDVSSIRQLGYGSAPIPPATIREAMDTFGCRFLQMYGTTELMGMSMMLTATDHETALQTDPAPLASAGRPLHYVQARIVDDAGCDLENGEAGELLLKTPYVIPGYWNADLKYSDTVRDGWLHTGDIAVIEDSGFVTLKDRAKFRIKSGGYNIFPVEIENCIAEHPDVDEVSVFGLPDPKWGDRIHGAVTLKEGAELDGDALRDYCRGRIADFKIPKAIEIWDALPKGPTGKIQKREIIEICVARG